MTENVGGGPLGPTSPKGGDTDAEVIVIDKPFLTRPRLLTFENDNSPDPIPLYRQVELLRDALRPFAELSELFRSTNGNQAVFSMNFGPGRWRELTINDFRRARTALSQTED